MKFELLDGTTTRYWSWAPSLLGEIVEMVYKKEFHNNFYPFTTKLNLIEFIGIVANIFGISNLSISCKKTGYYDLDNIILPKLDKYEEYPRLYIKKYFKYKKKKVMFYYMKKKTLSLKPRGYYFKVMKDGYLQNNFKFIKTIVIMVF